MVTSRTKVVMHDFAPILIAEDNDDDFFLFRRAARMAAIENPILRFRDGSELVAFLEKNPESPDADTNAPILVFIDLAMPIMNGFQVLSWLRAAGRKNYLPIVLSGSRREEDVRKAYELGAEEYLVKPLSPLLLAAMARRKVAVA